MWLWYLGLCVLLPWCLGLCYLGLWYSGLRVCICGAWGCGIRGCAYGCGVWHRVTVVFGAVCLRGCALLRSLRLCVCS